MTLPCLNAFTCVFFYTSIFVFALVVKHPVFVVTAFVSAFLCSCINNPKQKIKQLFSLYLPTIILITLLNGLTAHYGVTKLYSPKNGNNICLEPLVYGLVTAVGICTVLLIFANFSSDMTTDKLLFVFGKISKKTALILTLALRDYPMLKAEFKKKREAVSAFSLGDDEKFFDKIKLNIDILKSVVASNLENGIIRGDSMRARGYSLESKTTYTRQKITVTDKKVITVTAVLDILIIAGLIAGFGKCTYNPRIFFYIPDIKSITTYISYFCLCILPCILHIGEELRWKKSKSKT